MCGYVVSVCVEWMRVKYKFGFSRLTSFQISITYVWCLYRCAANVSLLELRHIDFNFQMVVFYIYLYVMHVLKSCGVGLRL